MTLLATACGGSSNVFSGIEIPSSTTGPESTSSTLTTTTQATLESTTTLQPPTPTTTTLEPTTTTTEAPVGPHLGFPSLVMADGNTIRSVGPSANGRIVTSVEQVAAGPVRVAYVADDLTVISQENLATDEPFTPAHIARYHHDGTREVIAGVSSLFGLAVISGEQSIIAAEAFDPSMESGDILAIGLDTGTITRLGWAWGPEYGVGAVEWSSQGMAVVSGWADQTESVIYIDTTGNQLTRPSPTDNLAYASPPSVVSAALSPDGSQVVWAEGPDLGYDEASGEFVLMGDPWVVKGMDLTTGQVVFALPIEFAGVEFGDSWIDSIRYSDTHLVVNRMQSFGDESVVMAPAMIDMTGAEPAVVPFDVVGNATLLPVSARP